MPDPNSRPTPRKGLKAPGKALWKAIVGDLPDGWMLDARELHLLHRACRCCDEVAQVEKAVDHDGVMVKGSRGQPVVHPGLAEARALRTTEQRLLRDLEMVDPAEVKRRSSPASLRARRAAESRWKQRSG